MACTEKTSMIPLMKGDHFRIDLYRSQIGHAITVFPTFFTLK
jgi:hypothetical protein